MNKEKLQDYLDTLESNILFVAGSLQLMSKTAPHVENDVIELGEALLMVGNVKAELDLHSRFSNMQESLPAGYQIERTPGQERGYVSYTDPTGTRRRIMRNGEEWPFTDAHKAAVCAWLHAELRGTAEA